MVDEKGWPGDCFVVEEIVVIGFVASAGWIGQFCGVGDLKKWWVGLVDGVYVVNDFHDDSPFQLFVLYG